MRSLLKFVLFVLLLAVISTFTLSRMTVSRGELPPRDGRSLESARVWGYQLQGVNPRRLAPEIELLVTDYSPDGSASGAWTPAEVAALRKRPDGSDRIVLAYMSIGEAENYRGYWRPHWRLAPPFWLGKENEEWKGNFAVRYWQSGWQRIIVDPAPSMLRRLGERWLPHMVSVPYLDQILEAGFDGVYLDKIDGFEDWSSERPSADADMVRFVASISAYAKARRPGALVVAQNGEALLENPKYIDLIDGIAKEDLWFGASADGVANTGEEVLAAVDLLNRAITADKPVFEVEYIDNAQARLEVHRHAERLGYRLLFANRELHLPPVPLRPLPPPAPAPPVAPAAGDGTSAPDRPDAGSAPAATAPAPSTASPPSDPPAASVTPPDTVPAPKARRVRTTPAANTTSPGRPQPR